MEQPCIHEGWLEDMVNEEMCPVAPFLKLDGPLFTLLKVGKAQQGRPSWKAPKCSHCPFLPLHTHPTSGLRDTVLGALHLVRSSSLSPRSSAPTRGGKQNLKSAGRQSWQHSRASVQYFWDDQTPSSLSATNACLLCGLPCGLQSWRE